MQETSVNHVELIAGLEEAKRKSLTDKSDLPGLIRLASHWGLIGLGTIWIVSGGAGWQVAMVFQGILLAFLFAAQHECSHATAFKTYQLNIWIARVCGFLLFLPPLWFRYFHFAHHRHTNDPKHDPELASSKPVTLGEYLWYVTGIPVWAGQIKALFGNAFGKPDDAFVPPRGKGKVQTEARLYVGLYATLLVVSLLTANSVLLFVWIIPVLLGQPFLRLCLLAEHMYCPLVSNMLENSRTTYTAWPVRWITWNMPYHAEHHAYPAIPFHKLPEFHNVAKEHVKTIQNGYAAFHKDVIQDLNSGTTHS